MNIEKEREAFEERFQHLDLDFVEDLGYCESETQYAWAAWWAATQRAESKLEGCVVVNTESLLLHAQSIRMFNDGDMENHYEEIEEHVCAIEEMVEAARGGNE
ncbi:hypothetical protein [Acinetobacter dispersus]|uniref:hypothetical protein n=1 Tax=Acinetobacter dispersus TaxID=70348 RepID=UPI001F4B2AB7|nr:hypothetical protein [Acinetobacter dispersus]MCH7390280.1 hypothetical protein [Acinetobacter dispersus]